MKSSNVFNFRKYSSFHIFSEAIDIRTSGGVTIDFENLFSIEKSV